MPSSYWSPWLTSLSAQERVGHELMPGNNAAVMGMTGPKFVQVICGTRKIKTFVTNKVLKFFKQANPGLFFNLFSSFLITERKNSVASGIWTQIVTVKGKVAYNYTTTTALVVKTVYPYTCFILLGPFLLCKIFSRVRFSPDINPHLSIKPH